jgi:hypothetical protein
MRKQFGRLAAVLIAVGLSACSAGPQQGVTPSSDGSSGKVIRRPLDTWGGIGSASMSVAMGDAAPIIAGKTLSHFYLGVVRVDALSSGSPVTLASFANPYALDILAYQNGAVFPLGSASVTPQQYTALRLVIATASSSVSFTDGSSLPLNFKVNQGSVSSAGAGKKTTTTADATPGWIDVTIPINETLGSGGADTMQIDFNALESLQAGNNALTVRPSVFAASAATSGAINGSVLNQNGAPVSNAVVVAVAQDGSVGNTAATDSNGNYNLHGLPAGTYALQVYNSYENATGGFFTSTGATSSASVITGPTISVTAGTTQSAGTIAD